jgi:hypothetical protein
LDVANARNTDLQAQYDLLQVQIERLQSALLEEADERRAQHVDRTQLIDEKLMQEVCRKWMSTMSLNRDESSVQVDQSGWP